MATFGQSMCARTGTAVVAAKEFEHETAVFYVIKQRPRARDKGARTRTQWRVGKRRDGPSSKGAVLQSNISAFSIAVLVAESNR